MRSEATAERRNHHRVDTALGYIPAPRKMPRISPCSFHLRRPYYTDTMVEMIRRWVPGDNNGVSVNDTDEFGRAYRSAPELDVHEGFSG